MWFIVLIESIELIDDIVILFYGTFVKLIKFVVQKT